MLTPRAFASSTVLRMMSASPAWKPQAMLTEVASSIMAASLPISHAPNPSPRSQLRSIVVMSMSRCASGSMLILRQRIRRRNLPCSGVDRADGGAGDISILQRLDVEIESLDRPDAVGQAAQQLRKLTGLALRLSHADGLEAEATPGGYLREPPEIGCNHRCNLGIAAAGAAIRHQDDRRAIAGHLDAAINGAVGDDVVAMQVFYDGALKPVAHAVARRRYPPLAVQKQVYRVFSKFVVLPAHHDAH